MEKKEYIGTYPVRKIGLKEVGIHMPYEAIGEYKIERIGKDYLLTWQGERK